MEVALDAELHLTDWPDADFEALVAKVESGIRDGLVAVLGGSRGPSELSSIGEGQQWLLEYKDQIATLLDLSMFAFEGAEEDEVAEWAEYEPPSEPEQALRWIRHLQQSAPSLAEEWTAHVDTYDRVLAAAIPQVAIDPERERIVGQLVLRTVVVDGASADPISDGAEAVTLALTMTRNELLYLAYRARRAADLLGAVLGEEREGDA